MLVVLREPEFEAIVALANLAPSIHNAQPARWRLVGKTIEIGADRSIILPQADPTGRHIGLSCGAALEATVLALSKHRVVSTAKQKWAKGQRKMLPLWGCDNHRIDERLHPGSRACHIAGGCPDALARKGQSVLIGV